MLDILSLRKLGGLTWNNVSSIERIFIFNKPKAIHKLDLRYFACPLAVEMIFDVLLRS